MAVKIKFDQTHNVIQPTIVLATRSGKKLGVLPVENIQVSDSMNTYFEFNFVIHKEKDGVQCKLWDQIEDFKLVWCKEWDVWFEIYVEVTEENDIVKNVNAKSLGEAELSQTNLYDVEINTDTDKARIDYKAEHPTIFYRNDPELKKASLLHRVLEKVPHYTIEYVAESLIKITKVPEFTFDGTSIYDSLQTIAEEYDCIFVINSGTNENGKIARGISAYDLESWCKDPKCGHRDTYFKVCPKCGGKNGHGVDPGYGEDTTIFVSTENLADNITYSTDTDSVKNCFKLEGGDDLMTATIVNCNPNGSGYMWHISDLTKRDMSKEMVDKLDAYDNEYNTIYNSYTPEGNIISENESRTFVFGTDFQINDVFRFVYIENEENKNATVTYDYGMSISVQTLSKDSPISEFKVFTKNVTIQTSENIRVYLLADLQRSISYYNDLVNYYNELMKEDYENIPDKIVGYPELMTAYYNTIDFYWYLKSGLMPNPKMEDTDKEKELAKLNATTLSSVAVQDLDSCSPSSADNAMLGMAKVLVDNRYKTEIASSEYNETSHVWSGKFTVTNYSNKEDAATHSDVVTVTIREDYEEYVKQKLEKTLNKDQDLIEGANSIVALFDLELNWSDKNGEVTFSGKFADEIRKYGLVSLETFRDSCQACLDILIEMGASDEEKKKDVHDRLYVDYYYKSLALLDEIKVREDEIAIVAKYDKDNNLISGLQYFILQEQSVIHQALDFEAWMGEYWLDFIAYRREDTYSNENYISDGLNNAELFTRAQEFIEAAKKDIYKSATLQHSITSTLKNLLVMKEFAPIVDYFAVGNWIRIKVDDEIYRLRLLSYTIDFDNLDSLTIEFSDVLKCANGVNDVESILNQAASMASSYGSVKRQANKAEKNNTTLNSLVDNGLNVTNTKIMSSDNQTQVWDRNGILCRSYDEITESYGDEQLKIINSTLAITDDGWKTIKTAIGKYVYTDPNDHTKEITAYGVLADTIVGRLIIGENLIISSGNDKLTFDDNGLVVKSANDASMVQIQPSQESIFSITDGNGIYALYLDKETGNLKIKGEVISTKLEVENQDGTTSSLANVAISGSYTDLINEPTTLSYFTDDVGYLKESSLPSAIDSALAQAKASGEFDGISVTHSWNGTTLTVTSASGTSSSDLKGSKGDTPVKGTDYWTDNDKSEIVNDVIEELRNQGLI